LLSLSSDALRAESYYLQALLLAEPGQEELHLCGRLGVIYISFGPVGSFELVLDRMKRMHANRASLATVRNAPYIFFEYTVVCYQFDLCDAAFDFCEDAIFFASSLSNFVMERDSLQLLGEMSVHAAQYSRAKAAYQASLDIAMGISNNRRGIIRVRMLLADVLKKMKLYSEAASEYEEAVAVAKEHHITTQIDCYNALSSLYKEWGRYADAIPWTKLAIEGHKSTGDQSQVLQATLELVESYWYGLFF
jgi:tetratricopeptide (TPR) repeat protein